METMREKVIQRSVYKFPGYSYSYSMKMFRTALLNMYSTDILLYSVQHSADSIVKYVATPWRDFSDGER